eukprot:CAMPEP_0168609546 /NCGR_PEP_ID=MMETSP0449_2-20121227/1269_1 /TAXON_ID=1082188 /ORGANISM="Strombidium rassoulzadegani, Strain ras09" /LENGTH=163 /DNA_ID=CAMNT_0008649707 /DNA_START=469 /DNA_END=957 /DNA_ORIENTATION=-
MDGPVDPPVELELTGEEKLTPAEGVGHARTLGAAFELALELELLDLVLEEVRKLELHPVGHLGAAGAHDIPDADEGLQLLHPHHARPAVDLGAVVAHLGGQLDDPQAQGADCILDQVGLHTILVDDALLFEVDELVGDVEVGAEFGVHPLLELPPVELEELEE